MHINIRTIVITFFVLCFATLAVWFGLERVVFYAKLHSPIAKPWIAVHLSSGEIFYGRLGGMASGMIELHAVRFLEKFTKANTGAIASDADANLNSQNFSLGAGNVEPSGERYIMSEKPSSLIIPLNSLMYIENVDPASEVYRYLR